MKTVQRETRLNVCNECIHFPGVSWRGRCFRTICNGALRVGKKIHNKRKAKSFQNPRAVHTLLRVRGTSFRIE